KMLWLAGVGASASFLAGRGPDEDESKAGWVLRKVLLDPLNTLPWAGQVAEQLATGKEADVRTAPELAYVENIANKFAGLTRKALDGDKDADEKLQALIDFIGSWAPAQVRRTGGYLRQLATGEASPRGPGDVAGGLVYGQRKNREPAFQNPAVAAQSLA